MYAIIVGAGKVGRNLARELVVKGHEVTLIESSRSTYLAIEEEFEHAVQYGDATELWVLERAGIQRADLVVAVTGDDEDNMLVCQVAKEKYLCDRIIAQIAQRRFGVEKVIVRVMDPARASWYGEQGLRTISPTKHAVEMFQEALQPEAS